MKVKRIVIHRFKSLQHVDLATDDINIIIGGNNSGKSSLLQAIQFSTSIVQTIITINHVKFNSDELSTTISSDQLLYSPARDVLTPAYGADELTQVPDKSIQIEFYLTNDNNQEISAIISIRRGKNKNLSVSLIGREACSLIGSLEQPFSMYVPGLAGIPFSEDYKALGAIRRAAAKGDW